MNALIYGLLVGSIVTVGCLFQWAIWAYNAKEKRRKAADRGIKVSIRGRYVMLAMYIGEEDLVTLPLTQDELKQVIGMLKEKLKEELT